MSKIFTHQELCEIAELWLKKDMKCCIALNNASGLKENPDAIGWRFTYGNLNKEKISEILDMLHNKRNEEV